jgi:hypothetical protein
MPSSQEIYRTLVDALKRGALSEPFTKDDFERVCPGLSNGTYRSFLWRFSAGGDVPKESVLLERVLPNGFRLVRPLKHGQ